MARIYRQNNSVRIDNRIFPGGIYVDFDDNNDFVFTDANNRPIFNRSLPLSEVQNESGVAFGTIDDALQYLTEEINSRGGGGAGFTIDSNHNFADAQARDDYFDPGLPVGNPTDNTDELRSFETLISVGAQFQRWDGATDPTIYSNTNWTNVSAVVRGQKGDTGTAGRTVLNGTGAPGGGLGENGDFYIDTAANDIYGPKNAGVWGSAVSLIGPTGPGGRTILNGTAAPSGGTGQDGDFFIDTTANNLYGPKASGAWGSPTSLVGPAGASGRFQNEPITDSITITHTNSATYDRHNVINVRDPLGQVVVTLDSIANFITNSVTDFVVRFINDSEASKMMITAQTGEFIGQIGQSITLTRGQSIFLKLPRSGATRWLLMSNTTAISGTTTPQRPDVTPTTINAPFVLEDDQGADLIWDASTGSFPTGTINKGYAYRNTRPGTVDNEPFSTEDILLAIVDNPSSSSFAGNWHRIDGSQYVHSIGGLTGAIDDTQLTDKLRTLGFEPVEPSAHDFSIDIPERVDLNTNLNVSHIATYSISNHYSVQGVELIVNAGDNKTLPVPTRDGEQVETIILSGIDSSAPTNLTFLIRVTDFTNVTHDSLPYPVTIGNLQTHEQAHFGRVLSTQDHTNIDFTNTDIEARDQFAGNWTVSGIPDDSNLYRLYFAVPVALGTITRITQGGFTLYDSSLSQGNQFAAINGFTIAAQDYNIVIANVGVAVNNTYNGTILTAS